ncbi:hypothetical protein FQN60_002048 [Etheostoma spectabile]|uniref:E3 ubiquitin-protein ligase n=1 Tax=Etheostoma spectabile TaxID=54343 RepID=A0A5J5DD82_9PERO|nr:hypothetical protein FQN60_002048 [Etheostoma spectabile]
MQHEECTGTQPEGTMTVTRRWQSLPGFELCGSNNTVSQEGYKGSTSRTALLPASEEGEKVLKLLRKAFDRRLTFTIGRSVTPGLNNVITWNDIHHKTNMDVLGYPDPEYLFRVQDELRLTGVSTYLTWAMSLRPEHLVLLDTPETSHFQRAEQEFLQLANGAAAPYGNKQLTQQFSG